MAPPRSGGRAWLLVVLALLAVSGRGGQIEGQGLGGQGRDENALDEHGVAKRGVEVRFADGSGANDARISRLVALFVPDGLAPTPFLTPGTFRATFHASLELGLNDSFWFGAEGRGAVRLLLRGEEVLAAQSLPEDGSVVRTADEIDLRKGGNELVLEYTSPASGPSELRLSWGSEVLPPEPVPPEVLYPPLVSVQLTEGLERRRGRDRFAERLCVRCHRPSSLELHMPELEARAPEWERLGLLRPEWVERWLLDPMQLRYDARMPRLLMPDPAMARSQAADIAAYLQRESAAASVSAVSSPSALRSGDAGAGERLYSDLGCETCHELRGLAAKWLPEGLQSYLADPTAHNSWSRMPRFELAEGEVADLAAFLQGGPPDGPPDRPQDGLAEETEPLDSARPSLVGDADRGELWVNRLRCRNCHEADPPRTEESPAALERLAQASDRGCLASEPGGGGHPDFALGTADLGALRSFVRTDLASLGRRVWEEFATRQVAALDCVACHARDGLEARWSGGVRPHKAKQEDDGEDFWQSTDDEDAPQIAPPHLTFAGEKLSLVWLEPFLAGELGYRPRPHLEARMPAFPSFAPGLARGLLEQHGYGPEPDSDSDLSPELVAIGADLVSGERLGCQSCHAQGELAALGGEGQQETINFAYVGERLRRSYFDRFLRDPQRILPGTKMPQFVDEDGFSALYDVFDGDAQRQFDAIWQYLRSLSTSR